MPELYTILRLALYDFSGLRSWVLMQSKIKFNTAISIGLVLCLTEGKTSQHLDETLLQADVMSIVHTITDEIILRLRQNMTMTPRQFISVPFRICFQNLTAQTISLSYSHYFTKVYSFPSSDYNDETAKITPIDSKNEVLLLHLITFVSF